MPPPPSPSDPTPTDATNLFKSIESKFPTAYGPDKWYLVVLLALTGGGGHYYVPNLYTYLIQQPDYSTSLARQALMRRIREALVKSISINGCCRPLEAIFGIARVTAPEDEDDSFSREHWTNDAANLERGENWRSRVYLGNKGPIDGPLSKHKDFDWINKEITYGLYQSDHTILNAIETEMVVLAGIMIQNLWDETHWHLRGLRRQGVSMEDVERIHQCIEEVAAFEGVKLDKVPRVADIEHEV